MAQVRGVSRVLAKLEASINEGRYYEAHQMYRTLHFRYVCVLFNTRSIFENLYVCIINQYLKAKKNIPTLFLYTYILCPFFLYQITISFHKIHMYIIFSVQISWSKEI